MARTVIDGFKKDLKLKTRYPELKFDKLRMYFGKPYVINLPSADGKVTVLVPKISQLLDLGEERFYNTLNIFTTNTTQYRLVLHRAEPPIDWCEISDFELFISLYKQADMEVVNCLFDNLPLNEFELYAKQQPNGERSVTMYHMPTKTEINEEVYQHIAQYLRQVFMIHVEEKITKDPILKAMYYQKDEVAFERAKQKKEKGEDEQSSIQPLVSSCINHPGFKYKLHELEEVNICEFYDSVGRLRIYENTRALLQGSYSGMMDTSKIDMESFNFMRKIS